MSSISCSAQQKQETLVPESPERTVEHTHHLPPLSR